MRKSHCAAGVAIAACFACVALNGQQPLQPREEALYLCSALERVVPGERLHVLVTGVMLVGPEHQIFFDPRQPECAMDVQPSTWLELADDTTKPARLNQILASAGRALVTIRGEIYGPPSLPPDDMSFPPGAAYANRIAGRRYGHLGTFRTKLVVGEFLKVANVPAELSAVAPLVDRRARSDDKALVSASLPLYPELARHAGIAGDVAVRVVVKGGEVVTAEPLSGERLLADYTVNYVRGWRFAPDTDTEFTALFVYRLEQRASGAGGELQHELHLPRFARITAAKRDW